MAKKRTKVCFIGLGLMGTPMAECLLKAGYPLTVWNRTPEKMEPLVAAGASKSKTPASAARGADFVVTMVADDAALDAVIFGEDGLSRGMKKRSMLVNCSTTSPAFSFRAATALRSLNLKYLEAPAMRSVQAARDGKLQILVGGRRDDFAKAKPILEVLGTDVHYIGESGRGAMMKLIGNLLVADLIQCFAEFFVLGRKAGIPFETMMEVLHAGPLECAMFRFAEQKVVNPGGRINFYLKHMVKDVNMASELARQVEAPIPVTTLVGQVLRAVKNTGHAEDDFSAVLDVMARWAGISVRG